MADTFSPRPVDSEQDFDRACSMLGRIFTDPADLYPKDRLRRYYLERDAARFYLFDTAGQSAGIMLVHINPGVPAAMYVSYAGVMEAYRGLLMPSEAQRLLRTVMRELGVAKLLIDAEDPSRIGHLYPGADRRALARSTARRLRFLQRVLGIDFIDDAEAPYLRPASSDPQTIQAYDLLGFCLRDGGEARWKDVYNADRTAIRLSAYVEFYLELLQLEYGSAAHIPTADQLRATYPAVEAFFRQIDRQPHKEWVSLVARA